MAYCSVYENIIFIEGDCDYLVFKENLQYERTVYNQQLKNLYDVKHQLAEKAKSVGANAVIHFEYGQKSKGWFISMLLAFDDNINWHASGDAVVISNEKKEKILNKIKNNN